MKLVDYRCINCKHVEEEDYDKYGDYKLCPKCGKYMQRLIGYSQFRIIEYSPEYHGGSNKNLINQPKELVERNKK